VTPPTRREFLRAYRRHLDRTEPGWRDILRREADLSRPGWSDLEVEVERADGTRLVVALLCRGGPDGERIDDPDPPAEVRAAA
jgi:hypothetical protein